MTAVDLDALDALAAAATPGPWHVHEMDRLFVGNGSPESLWQIVHTSADLMSDLRPEAADQARADAAFIAAARDAVPALTAELRRTRTLCREVIDMRDALRVENAALTARVRELEARIAEPYRTLGEQRDEARAEVARLTKRLADRDAQVDAVTALCDDHDRRGWASIVAADIRAALATGAES